MKRRSAFLLVAIAACAGTASAAPRDPVKADRLFREGQHLLARGDVRAACQKLADSHALDPVLGTLLNLAYCHEKEGRRHTAWTEYRRAASEAKRTEQHERASFARERMNALAAQLPHAVLELPRGARAAKIRLDGETVEGAPLDFVVAPGEHEIEVETVEGERHVRRVTFPDVASTLVVKMGTTETPEVTPAPVVDGTAPAPPPGSSPAPPSAERDDGGSQRIVGFALGGAGVVALGVGTYFGIATFSKKSDADAGCDATGCNPAAKEAGDQAHSYATLSTAFVVGGLVLGAAGLYFVLTAPSRSGTVSTRLGPFGIRGTF